MSSSSSYSPTTLPNSRCLKSDIFHCCHSVIIVTILLFLIDFSHARESLPISLTTLNKIEFLERVAGLREFQSDDE